jgi:large subunit ribosomal protein L7A
MLGRLSGEKVVGVKQTAKALNNEKGKVLYVAKDADSKLVEPIIELAKANSLQIVYVETMKELGTLCAIEVSAATALML